MGLRESIARFFYKELQTPDQIKELVQEELKRAKAALPLYSNYDPNDEGYRRLTSQSDRDLEPMDQDRMILYSYYLWDYSGTFRRLALLDNTMMFGEPIRIVCNDKSVQDWVNNFWNDPDNDMETNFSDLCMWMSILGEQCWPVEVNEANGFVTLGYVDPYDIKDILVRSKNKRKIGKVVIKNTVGQPDEIYEIIKVNNDPSDKKKFGRLTGDCFFFSLNHPPNSPRGRSDFRTLFDWIDAWEAYGFNYLTRAELLLSFIWDVTVNGGEEALRKFKEDNKVPPKPGALRIHNENVKWTANTPAMNAVDFKMGGDMGKNTILGMAGRPDSWFGSGGKAYQSEADFQGMVPIKDLDKRQNRHRKDVIFMIKFAIDQGIIYGSLDPEVDTGFEVIMPEISKKDLAKIAGVLPGIVNSAIISSSEGFLTRRSASRLIISAINQMGDNINPEQEFNDAQEEKKERDKTNSMQDYAAIDKIREMAAQQRNNGKDRKRTPIAN